MISSDDAFAYSNDPDELRAMIEGRPAGPAAPKPATTKYR
jgi:hypothetical protein